MDQECKANTIEITQLVKDKADIQAKVQQCEKDLEEAEAAHKVEVEKLEQKLDGLMQDMVKAKRVGNIVCFVSSRLTTFNYPIMSINVIIYLCQRGIVFMTVCLSVCHLSVSRSTAILLLGTKIEKKKKKS